MGARENEFQSSQNYILHTKFSDFFTILVNLTFIFSLAGCFHQHAVFKQCKKKKRSITFFYQILISVKNIPSSSLFLSPMTNFSSWQKITPLYNSSEVFVPAKKYRNTIHSPCILKTLNVTHCKHTVPLFTSNPMRTNSSLYKRFISMHNNN